MDRQIARGYATNAICAIIGTDGVIYTMDYRARKQAVAQFTKDGKPTDPLTCDTAVQAQAILKVHRYLGIVMPVVFESEFNAI